MWPTQNRVRHLRHVAGELGRMPVADARVQTQSLRIMAERPLEHALGGGKPVGSLEQATGFRAERGLVHDHTARPVHDLLRVERMDERGAPRDRGRRRESAAASGDGGFTYTPYGPTPNGLLAASASR